MHRRNFLHATGGVMIGSITHASSRLSDDSGPRLRVGQIGTQHAHAAGQLQTVLALPQNFEMVGVVEPDPERRCAHEGIRARELSIGSDGGSGAMGSGSGRGRGTCQCAEFKGWRPGGEPAMLPRALPTRKRPGCETEVS